MYNSNDGPDELHNWFLKEQQQPSDTIMTYLYHAVPKPGIGGKCELYRREADPIDSGLTNHITVNSQTQT